MEQPIKVVQGEKQGEWVTILIGFLAVISIVIFCFFAGAWYNQSRLVDCQVKLISPIPEVVK